MSKTAIAIGVICVAVVGALVVFWPSISKSGQAASVASSKQIHVRWLLSHQPTAVFSTATKIFADTLLKESGGRLVVDVLNPSDVGFTGTGDIPYTKTIQYLDSGKAEISGTYAVLNGIADPQFSVVNLPYLFKDYASASKVFDSAIGTELLDSFSQKSSVRALQFTYSGGYRVIVSKNTQIKDLKDIKGLKIATSGGVIAEEFLRSLGAIPISIALEASSTDALKDVDAVETTYSRLSESIGKNTSFTKYINETSHSLFMTTMVVSDSFYDSLSSEDKAALQKAAAAAAQVERADSIALGEKTKADLLAAGSIVTTPSADLIAAFKKNAESMAKKYMTTFRADIVEDIQKAQQ